MVAFGFLLSLAVSTGVTTAGIATLLMGLAFGMSFVLILVSGTSLITADMAAGFLAVLQRRMSASAYCRVLGVGFAGNTIGALIFVAICAAAGGPYLGGFAERAATVGALKAGQPFCTALLLALLCTWFLHTSMCMFFQARSDVARMGFAFYGPFRVCDRRHPARHRQCRLPWAPDAPRGVPCLAPHSGIGWGFGSHVLTSLCITALGNLIGGTLFVAMPFRSSHGCSTERTKAGVTARTAAHTSALGDDIAPGTTAVRRGENEAPES